MADIRNPRLLYLKGALFVLLGLLASGLLIAEHPTLRTVLLLAVAVWSFARAYYFAFYVIEHYIDPQYRFAGLGHVLRYLLGRRSRGASSVRTADEGTSGFSSPGGAEVVSQGREPL